MIPTTTKIVRVGNALAVEVSEELLAQTGLSAGEAVEWVLEDGGRLHLVRSPLRIVAELEGSSRISGIPGFQDQDSVRAQVQAGLADMHAGRSVSHARVVAWLDSWGKDHELPMPECS